MPPPPTDKQNQGQILYRNGDYSGALQIFNSILEKWPDKKNIPVGVLNNRAATLVRLERYDDALKDARTMIEADNTSSSGFMCACQILEKQGNFKKAIKVYIYGLRSVIDPAASKLLKDGLEEAKRHISPEKANDWMMNVLPIEVLEIIINLLPLRNMVRLLQVCRLWKTVLSGIPRFWKDLDFGTRYSTNVKHKTLQAYAERAQWKVRRITLPGAAPGTISMLLDKCRTLETLRLGPAKSPEQQLICLPRMMHTKNLQNLHLLFCPMKFSQVFNLIHSLPNLTRFSVCVLPGRSDLLNLADAKIPARMRSLLIQPESCNQEFYLGALLANARDLEHLALSDILDGEFHLDHLHQLKDVHLGLHASTEPIRFPSSIEKIRIDYGSEVATPFAYLDNIEDGSLPLLKTIRINSSIVEGRVLELLHQCGRQLQELVISGSALEVFDYFSARLSQGDFPLLAALIMLETEISDDDLEFIGQNCPSLTDLSLDRGIDITGSGIRRLVEAAPQLKRLYIFSCPDISMDAIHWARAQGIIVHYNTLIYPYGNELS